MLSKDWSIKTKLGVILAIIFFLGATYGSIVFSLDVYQTCSNPETRRMSTICTGPVEVWEKSAIEYLINGILSPDSWVLIIPITFVGFVIGWIIGWIVGKLKNKR